MPVNFDIHATYGNDPIDVLSDLIGKRVAVLNEWRKDAVVATMITVLTSLRAATKQHKGKGVKVSDGGNGIGFVRVTSCHPSFTRGHVRCIRSGQRVSGRRGARISLDGKVVNLVPPGERWDEANVYLFMVPPALRERWQHQPARQYVVCRTDAGVKSYLQTRYGNIARKNTGAARMAIGIAAAKVSTRPQRVTNPGKNAKRTAERCIGVDVQDGADVYTVSVTDSLSYAVDALNGGKGAIQLAMMKAANRVAGMLRAKAHGPLKDQLRTPFPEVVRPKGRK